MRIHLRMALLPLLLLTGCGGDKGTGPTVTPPTVAPAPAPTPTPTPTPPANYSGIYSGTMAFTIAGVPQASFQARLEVTHDGNTLDLGTMDLPGLGSFPLKTATMTSATEFVGSAGYGSIGCGRVKVSTQGSFEGSNMQLLAGLTSDCIQAKLSGYLTR